MRAYAWLCYGIVSTAASAAYGGAWTLDAGKAQAIVTSGYYGAEKLWDSKGHTRPQPHYHKLELNPYLEYGVWDGLTAGAALSLQGAYQKSAAGTQNAQRNWGMGDAELFARQRLYQHGGYVVSLEPMVKIPGPEKAASAPRIGSSHYDAGLGASGGYGFAAYGYRHYINLDTQYRRRFGYPHDQVRLGATVGAQVADQWTVMPQGFLTLRTDHTATGFTQSPDDDYTLGRLQLSALYALRSDVSLQGGVFADVYGKNAGVGRGVVVAIWKRW